MAPHESFANNPLQDGRDHYQLLAGKLREPNASLVDPRATAGNKR
jgi:hypothetical protein